MDKKMLLSMYLHTYISMMMTTKVVGIIKIIILQFKKNLYVEYT